MFTRFSDGLSSLGNLLKKTGIVLINATPGLALMIARGGSGVFNAMKLADYFSKLVDSPLVSSTSVPGKVLASIILVGTAGTNLYTRFWNSYRAKTKQKSIAQNPLEEKLLSTKEPETATCCYPGINTGSRNSLYKFTQVTNSLYAWGSFSSGILSAHSLITLLQLWIQFDYNSKCGEKESNYTQITLMNLLMMLLMIANLKSYLKYNLIALREYMVVLFIYIRLFTEDNTLFTKECYLTDHNDNHYKAKDGFLFDEHDNQLFNVDEELITPEGNKLILKKGWHEISYFKRFEITIGSLLSTVGVWYAMQTLIELFKDTTLCPLVKPLGVDNISIPHAVSDALAGIGAVSNFITVLLLTMGAYYNKQEKERKKTAVAEDEKKQNESNSEFGCMYPFIKLFILINALNSAMGTFISCATLPETMGHHPELIMHPGVISTSIVFGIFAWLNQFILDTESVRREEDTRRKLRIQSEENRSEHVLPGFSQSGITLFKSPRQLSSIVVDETKKDDLTPLLFKQNNHISATLTHG